MSGTEILIILVIGVIVIGPKRLPVMMRTLGRWIAKARRTIFEVRANTGIDKLIREEGLENEIREISSLTRSNVLSTLVNNNPAALAARTVSGALSSVSGALPADKSKDDGAKADAARSDAAKPVARNALENKATVVAPLGAATAAAAPEPALMGGPAPNAAALSLIKPAAGAVSRRDEDVLRLLMRTATGSIRDREYPTIGCDSYDVIPDDIDDPEAYADEPEPADEPATSDDASAEPPKNPEPPAETERAV